MYAILVRFNIKISYPSTIFPYIVKSMRVIRYVRVNAFAADHRGFRHRRIRFSRRNHDTREGP